MKCLKIVQPLVVDKLPLPLKIEGSCIKVIKLTLYNDIFNAVDQFFHHHYLALKKNGNGGILTYADFSFAFPWNKKSVFVFDKHSRDNIV